MRSPWLAAWKVARSPSSVPNSLGRILTPIPTDPVNLCWKAGVSKPPFLSCNMETITVPASQTCCKDLIMYVKP